MKTIVFQGLRRSGNHGIINMILRGSVNYVHMNDIDWDLTKYIKYKDQPITFRIIDRMYTGFKEATMVLLSVEDCLVCDGILDEFYRCTLIRNPLNNMASIWKMYGDEKRLVYYKNKWKEYANYILKTIPRSRDIVILYDRFYKDTEYRLDILNKLGVEYREEYLGEKPGWAKSSFPDRVTILNNEFNRYLNYKNDPIFIKNVLEDRELLELWGALEKL